MTPSTEPSESRWARLQRELGLRMTRRLYDELTRESGAQRSHARRGFSWSLGLAYAMALLVHGASVLFGVAGVWLLIRPWPTMLHPLVALILLLLFWIARPRLNPVPDHLLTREDCPTLYALADRMAKALDAPPVAGIGHSADFNANYRRAGWANATYIELGAPLLAILTHAERVAIMAHELSHGANGDPMRGRLLHSAVHTLAEWGTGLRPTAIGSVKGESGVASIPLVSVPFELLMLSLSELVFVTARGLQLLVLRQSQRAEYLADRLAASIAGSHEMQTALEKTYLDSVVDEALRLHAMNSPNAPLGNTLALAAAALPTTDLDALREESRASQWRVDATHPPTALRIGMLETTPMHAMPDLLSPAEEEALAREIDRVIALSDRELINRQVEAMNC